MGVAIYFVIKMNLNYAVLAMLVLFTLTNTVRELSFKSQGLERESKRMRRFTIFFGITFVGMLVLTFNL